MLRLNKDAASGLHAIPRRRFVYLYARDSGRIMAAARRAAGLSQRAVADALGVSRAIVSRLESGQAEMSASAWFYFCRLVCIDCDAISYGYRRAEHLTRVGRAIQDGHCPFMPSTALLSAVKRNDRRMAIQMKRLHQEIFGEFWGASD